MNAQERPPSRFRSRRHFGHALCVGFTAFSAFSAVAAERTWDGGGRSSHWSDDSNWTGLSGAPVAGDSLRFPSGALRLTNTNDFASATSFDALTFAGSGYSVAGNEVTLTGGIVVAHAAGTTTLSLPITLEASQTFLITQPDATLLLNGDVDLGRSRSSLTFDGAGEATLSGQLRGTVFALGTGSLRKNGSGTLTVLGNGSWAGATVVNGGTFRLEGSLSNSPVTLSTSATLRGGGKMGGLVASAGATVSPGGGNPDALESFGNLAINAGSTLNVRLNGRTPRTSYDQLVVHGTVTLGGTLNVSATFIPDVGERFTLIENDGTDEVVGTFAGLPDRALLMINGRPFQIRYGERGLSGLGRDVNDVTLEAVPGLSVWDGGGGLNNFWSQPLNWVGDVVPMPGDDIRFLSSGTTSNDFPAGRRFGSLILSSSNHRIQGVNLGEFEGDIQITESGKVSIEMPIGLSGGFRLTHATELTLRTVTLRANQTFSMEHNGSLLNLEGSVDLGTHDLTIRGESTSADQIEVRGSFSGSGTLYKEGAASLSLWGLNVSGANVINGGRFLVQWQPQGDVGEITGPTTVNAGATISVFGRVSGDLTVLEGAVTGSSGQFGNVNMVKGRFAQQFAKIDGNLRMSEGAVYAAVFDLPEAENIGNAIEATVEGTTELNDAVLEVSLGTTDIQAGDFSIILSSPMGITGMFRDLPEGARFVVGGRVLRIHYTTKISLSAQDPLVWDGGGENNLWTTSANWVGDFAPVAGLDLVFPNGINKLAALSDLPDATSFRSLSFSGPSYVLAGNRVTLTVALSNLVSSGETTLYSDINVVSTLNCQVSGSSRLNLADNLTGNGTWLKTGSGTVQLSGGTVNSSGNWRVLEGELELNKTAGLNAMSNRLDVGTGSNDVRVSWLESHQLPDTAQVTVLNRARLQLNGQEDTIGSLAGSGLVSLQGRSPSRPSRLTVQSGDFSGFITGNGGITKMGPADLLLSGDNDYTGTTVAGEGTLTLEGVQTNSTVHLDGGLLRGRGWVGTITSDAGGTVAPGLGQPGNHVALHARDVTFNPATTLHIQINSDDPGFENSLLDVGGIVDLDGCALKLEPLFVPAVGESFLILANDRTEPIVGAFGGLPEGAVFEQSNLRWRVSYIAGSGNDVSVTLIEHLPPAFTSFRITRPFAQYITVQFTASAMPRTRYFLETSTNLSTWTTSQFMLMSNPEGLLTYGTTAPDSFPRRFHRLKLVP